jgi:diguanylate cyclase (GGDEF)-like protein
VISARPLAAGARGVWRDVTEERARDQALADARHRERLMAYVVRAIRDQVEPAKTLEAAVAAVCRALDADGAIIWRGTSDGMAVAARRGDAEVNDLAARDAAAMTGPHACDLAGGSALVEATRFAGRVNGALGVVRGGERPAWSGADRAFLGDLAAQLGIALAQIEGQETLSRLADTDMLTGLMNRRAFARALDQRLQLARREGRNGALAYIDLDNFKPINDRLGHPAGDAALRAVAELLRAQGRAGDLAARLGGDEFALWLDGAKRDGAKQRAERLLDSRAALAPVSVDAEHPLGMSIGMAMHDPKVPETADAMIARADAVMYAAKRAGKGRCRFAPAAKARKASA